MDKAWVWLPRNSLEYEAGATKFVVESASNLGNPSEMFCPCLLCRNVCHQSMDTVVEHLVIKGMDQKYKRSKCWSLHGDIMNEKTPNVDSSENEAYELFRIHLSTLDESTKKSSPLQSGTNSTGTSKGSKKNCFLLDCDNSGEQVAIGRVCSTDPEDKVHLCPLGPNASKIWVEVSKIDGARVWRPNSEIQVISDAVGNWVAWPNKHIVFM
ncbi:Transposase-associated domain [Arabidopsis thaliana x Arabidopsis arenosa]|uniref:Transposase-associated domain n=1 Tax=Arabidopsis thaliana x Arabidopsis arenosa TaxID=1240361 RepID=A0A8T1YBR8_9BRAS|nr:Transposase-associated domain [Arabidopsis thaliana x Arabidopsis arenosa]